VIIIWLQRVLVYHNYNGLSKQTSKGSFSHKIFHLLTLNKPINLHTHCIYHTCIFKYNAIKELIYWQKLSLNTLFSRASLIHFNHQLLPARKPLFSPSLTKKYVPLEYGTKVSAFRKWNNYTWCVRLTKVIMILYRCKM
jgi:hypothetical protein